MTEKNGENLQKKGCFSANDTYYNLQGERLEREWLNEAHPPGGVAEFGAACGGPLSEWSRHVVAADLMTLLKTRFAS